MATEPPPFVRFKTPLISTGPADRVPVYQLALEFAQKIFTVVELTETVERFYLRDNLDKKSTSVPLLISRGLATAEMAERRDLYRRAHRAAHDCVVILDVLQQRGTIEEEALSHARAVGCALGMALTELTIEPSRVR